MTRKIYQYGSTVYQKMQNSNIWGVCFVRKVEFFNIFMRKSRFKIFEITMELHCNLKNLKSWFSHKNIEKLNFSYKTYPPNVAILHLLVYCRPILIYFSGQKLDFKIFRFSPIINSMFSYYNLKKGWRGKIFHSLNINHQQAKLARQDIFWHGDAIPLSHRMILCVYTYTPNHINT